MQVFLTINSSGVRAYYFDPERAEWVLARLSASGAEEMPLVWIKDSTTLGHAALQQGKMDPDLLQDTWEIRAEEVAPLLIALVGQALAVLEKEILYREIETVFCHLHPEITKGDSAWAERLNEALPTVHFLPNLAVPDLALLEENTGSWVVLHLGYRCSQLSFYRKKGSSLVEDEVITSERVSLGLGLMEARLAELLFPKTASAHERQQIRTIRERLAKDKREEWTIKSNGEKALLEKSRLGEVVKNLSREIATAIQEFSQRCQHIYPRANPHFLLIADEDCRDFLSLTPLKISLPRVIFSSPSVLIGQLLSLSPHSMNPSLENHQEFYVLAQDGRQYGPATKEKIQAWIDEGRLTGKEQIMPVQWHPITAHPALSIPQ